MSVKYKYSSSNLLFLKNKMYSSSQINLIHTHILNLSIQKNRVNEYIKNHDYNI